MLAIAPHPIPKSADWHFSRQFSIRTRLHPSTPPISISHMTAISGHSSQVWERSSSSGLSIVKMAWRRGYHSGGGPDQPRYQAENPSGLGRDRSSCSAGRDRCTGDQPEPLGEQQAYERAGKLLGKLFATADKRSSTIVNSVYS